MDHEAVLTFAYDDPASASLVERSVARELGEIGGERTRAGLEREGSTVRITVGAADFVALRAGLTTWTGLVETAERVGGVAVRRPPG